MPLLLPSLGAAASQVFGPKDYVYPQGSPQPLVEAFSACRPERPAKLRIQNGPSGKRRATRATVVLNNRESLVVTSSSSVRERSVDIESQNSLSVSLQGSAGATVRVSISSDLECLDLGVTSPTPNAEVPSGLLPVRGTVGGSPEIGVAVNGTPAAVIGGAFTAMIAVDYNVSELVVVATAPDGVTRELRQPLSVLEQEAPVSLRATPSSGGAPLSVTFSVASTVAVATLSLDLEGDGTADFQGPSLDGQAFTYAGPGVFLPTLTVIDTQGQQHVAVAQVQVHEPAVLDAFLRGKWTILRDALLRGDAAGAAAAFLLSARDAYLDEFTTLASLGALPEIANDLGALTLVRVRSNAAEYEVRVLLEGVEYSFYVLFAVDSDGVWRIAAF